MYARFDRRWQQGDGVAPEARWAKVDISSVHWPSRFPSAAFLQREGRSRYHPPGPVSNIAGRLSFPHLLAASSVIALLAGNDVIVRTQNVDPRVQYQQRGNHYEGLRAEPISGSVRLLSARIVDETAVRANAPERSAAWEEHALLRFFLPSAGAVSIVVRQIRPGSTYYVMDRVKSTWTVGRDNEYAWRTEPVLRKLPDVRPDDLGAVVLLSPGANPDDERILPVVLFSSTTPSAKTYRFSFKTDGRARVEATILDGAKRVGRREPNWEDEGSPFVVAWSPSPSTREGWFRLLLTGQFEDGNKLDRVMQFYHRGGGAPERMPR